MFLGDGRKRSVGPLSPVEMVIRKVQVQTVTNNVIQAPTFPALSPEKKNNTPKALFSHFRIVSPRATRVPDATATGICICNNVPISTLHLNLDNSLSGCLLIVFKRSALVAVVTTFFLTSPTPPPFGQQRRKKSRLFPPNIISQTRSLPQRSLLSSSFLYLDTTSVISISRH